MCPLGIGTGPPLPGVISLIHAIEHTDYNLLAVDLLFSLGS